MKNNSTDMMAEARNAQWSPVTFLGKGSVRVVAPAKVNLFLGVGAKRADGYHDVTTVMHALALHDTLHVNCVPWEDEDAAGAGAGAGAQAQAQAAQAASDQVAIGGPADNLHVTITIADKTAGLGRSIENPLQVPAAQNLVFRAADLLARTAGDREPRMIKVHIEKQIPSQAGLGGGSADAAAAVVALAHFWDVTDEALVADVAAGLGADVAFFLKGGCGLYTGGGEIFQHALEPSRQPVIVVRPDVGVPTKEAYTAFDANPIAVPPALLSQVEQAVEASQVPLFNNLTEAAQNIAPELAEVHAWLAQKLAEACGGSDQQPLLTGSGSAIFAITDSFAHASKIASDAQAQGWWARATTFAALRALVVEAQ